MNFWDMSDLSNLEKTFTEELCLQHFDSKLSIIIEVDVFNFVMIIILY
jgi:hypothetical protein